MIGWEKVDITPYTKALFFLENLLSLDHAYDFHIVTHLVKSYTVSQGTILFI